MTTTKQCGKCHADFPLTFFSKNRQRKDGQQSWCKDCMSTLWGTVKARYADHRRTQSLNYMKSARGRYSQLKATTKRTGQRMELTFDQYYWIVKSNCCFYCGDKLAETGYGLDRINNDIGYVMGNVRPCCKTCNYFKKATTEDAFRSQILKISQHWLKADDKVLKDVA